MQGYVSRIAARPLRRLELGLEWEPAVVPALDMDPPQEELPDRACRGHRGQGHQHPRDAVELAARQQAEDDEQRMETSAFAITLGTTMWPSTW